MAFTFAQTRIGYGNLWNGAKITPEKKPALKAITGRIVANKTRYQAVERATGVPWAFIGALHYREADLNLGSYLGNGQSLHQVTTEVPRDRGPFDSFEAGAEDALRLQGFVGVSYQWTLERMLYNAEEFNGEGYEHLDVNSPYVWDWTSLYTGGLFTGDHHFDPQVRENRAGVAAILWALAVAGEIKLEREKRTPMDDTAGTGQAPAPVVLPTSHTDPIATLAGIMETILPFLGTFFPPIVPLIPIIEAVLHMVGDIMAAQGNPIKIAEAIGKHIATIGNHAAKVGPQG